MAKSIPKVKIVKNNSHKMLYNTKTTSVFHNREVEKNKSRKYLHEK